MKNPLPLFALVTAALAPMAAEAQYNSPPGYTFGMFPNMFGTNNSYGNYGFPQGYMNNGQSPFMTMPAPQYPYANPQFPSTSQPQATPFPAAPMAQPTPFWMQTPQSAQQPSRYITEVPSNTAPIGGQGYILYPPNLPSTVTPRATPPSYSVFTAPGFTPGPPRWAPLPGQGPLPAQTQQPRNNWSAYPNTGQTPYAGQAAPAIPATPPKWPTP